MTLQPADLDRLEQLAREATPGPWHVVSEGGPGPHEYVTDIGTAEDDDAVCCFGHGYDDYGSMSLADAAYIAALDPAVVLELVAAARLGAAQATALAAAFDQVDAVRLGLSPENWWYGEGFDQALECFEPLRLLLAEAFPGRAG